MRLMGINLFGQRRFTASNGAVYLDKIRFSEEKSGFYWTEFEFILYCSFLAASHPIMAVLRTSPQW